MGAVRSFRLIKQSWRKRFYQIRVPRSTISLDTDLRPGRVRMSQLKNPVSGGAEAADGAPETAGGGRNRWSARRKRSVALELFRGADLESTSRRYGVTAATLSK